MSVRVCYIQRTDRGAVIDKLRLIGMHTDMVWHADVNPDPMLSTESIRAGARWIAQQTKSSKSKSIPILCIDTNGAVCSWVNPDEASAEILMSTLSENEIVDDSDGLDPEPHVGASDRFPRLPLELSFDPLSDEETSTGARAAVMANPDIPARLLKDELDKLGIQVGTVSSLWQAMAKVWDPGARSTGTDAQRIVASTVPVAAVILIDPVSGRLLWTWSKAGELITAGSARLERIADDQSPQVIVKDQDIARLCSDWLSWSSQLGASPSRIVVVGEPTQLKNAPSTSNPSAANSESAQSDEPEYVGLSASQLGVAISKAWPQALSDLMNEPDPVGTTLSKLAASEHEDLDAITTLKHRPGRSHRSMYRWGGIALLAVSSIIWIAAYQLLNQKNELENKISGITNERMTELNQFDPSIAISPFPEMDLQNRLQAMRNTNQPILTPQAKPILQELETVSFVLGMPGIEIDSISLNNSLANVSVVVEDINQAESINQSLSSIAGSNLRWYNMTPTNQGQSIRATYSARWNTEDEQGDES